MDLPAAAQAALGGGRRAVDVGEVNGQVFLNNSSLGIYPDMVRERTRQQRRLGRGKRWATVWAVISALRRFPFLELRLEVDAHRQVCRAPFVFIGNNAYSMSAFDIGTRARLDEGLLSIYSSPALHSPRAGRARVARPLRPPSTSEGLRDRLGAKPAGGVAPPASPGRDRRRDRQHGHAARIHRPAARAPGRRAKGAMMRTLVHLSDLHFGAVNEAVLEPLRACVQGLAPDLLVVSGDLTQRAKPKQFEAARAFLATLPQPQIVVPRQPRRAALQRVHALLQAARTLQAPRHVRPRADLHRRRDRGGRREHLALLRLQGRAHQRGAGGERAREAVRPAGVGDQDPRHPPSVRRAKGAHEEDQIVGRARMALERLANCGADVLLSGHLHASHVGHTAERYRIAGLSALIVQAGTATSHRGRGEPNSFNALRVESHRIEVERYEERGGDFVRAGSETYVGGEKGWSRESTS
jgi:predicted phosphodiesterase